MLLVLLDFVFDNKCGQKKKKKKIASAGVNRQRYHTYLAFICTHLKGIARFHLEIGVISCFVPNYTCHFCCCGLQNRKNLVYTSAARHTQRKKLIINAQNNITLSRTGGNSAGRSEGLNYEPCNITSTAGEPYFIHGCAGPYCVTGKAELHC